MTKKEKAKKKKHLPEIFLNPYRGNKDGLLNITGNQ